MAYGTGVSEKLRSNGGVKNKTEDSDLRVLNVIHSICIMYVGLPDSKTAKGV